MVTTTKNMSNPRKTSPKKTTTKKATPKVKEEPKKAPVVEKVEEPKLVEKNCDFTDEKHCQQCKIVEGHDTVILIKQIDELLKDGYKVINMSSSYDDMGRHNWKTVLLIK